MGSTTDNLFKDKGTRSSLITTLGNNASVFHQCCPQKASAEFSTPSYISYRINLDMFRFEQGRRGGRKGKWSGHYEQRSVSAGCPQGSLGSPAGRVTPRVQACHYCSREQNTLVSLETEEEACNNRNAHNYMITNESMDLERLFVLTDSSSVSSTRAGREFLLASW